MAAGVTIDLESLIRLKAEARGFHFSSRQPLNSLLSGRHASRLRGRGLDFAELRGYRPGDDIRSIDWKATARRGRTQIRVYEEERERPVYVAVDQRSRMFFGSQRCMKSVCAAEAAALAAWRVLDGGDRVGGWILGEQELQFVSPKRGQSTVLQFLHQLSEENEKLPLQGMDGNKEGFNHMLASIEQSMTHDGLLILISDLHGADEQSREMVTRLSRHNDVLVVLIYDPMGGGILPYPGMWTESASGLRKLPGQGDFSEKLREQFQVDLKRWRELFGELRIPLLPISTEFPVADQIRQAIGGELHG